MEKEKKRAEVDKGLVAMFLRMTVEERLLANDNAANTILELKDAFRKGKNRRQGAQRTSNRSL